MWAQQLMDCCYPQSMRTMDAIWQHTSRSTLAHVVAWCLMAPGYYLYLWWLNINIGSGNGSVPSGTTSLPEPMLAEICVAICHNWATSRSINWFFISKRPYSHLQMPDEIRCAGGPTSHLSTAVLAGVPGIARSTKGRLREVVVDWGPDRFSRSVDRHGCCVTEHFGEHGTSCQFYTFAVT